MKRVHTHYDNLKVTRNAPLEVIRAAYRVLAQKYHPDVNPSPAAANTMRIINEAWQVLGDLDKRAEHDRWIAQEEAGPAEIREPARTAPGHPPQRQDPREASGLRPGINKRTLLGLAIGLPAFVGAALYFAPAREPQLSWPEPTPLAAVAPAESRATRAPASHPSDRFRPSTEANRPAATAPNAKPSNPPRAAERRTDPELQAFTGYVPGAPQRASDGLSTFTVNNTQGSRDAIARLYLDGEPPAARSFYVKAGETFTARSMSPGRYILRYRFIDKTTVYEAERVFDLVETDTGSGTRYSNVTVTLYEIRNGNLTTKVVPADRF